MCAAVAPRSFDNGFCKLALIEGIPAALSDQAKRTCQIQIAENLPDNRRFIVWEICPGGSLISAQEIGVGAPQSGGPFSDRKSVFGGANGRREHFGHFLLSKTIQEFLPTVHRSRHRHALDAVRGHVLNALLS